VLYNRERLNDFLDKHDLKALVVTTPVNVAYLTGFSCWMYQTFRESMTLPGAPNTLLQSYAVVSTDRKPTLIVGTDVFHFASELDVGEVRSYASAKPDLPRAGKSSQLIGEFADVISNQRKTPGEALTSVIKEVLKDKGGRVGLEHSNLSEETRQALKKLDNVKFLECSELIRLVRMVKTAEEVEKMKRAAAIMERALNKSLNAARPGITAGELIRVFSTELSRQGAIPEHYIFSPIGLGISSVEGYRFRKGDFTSIDCGTIYKHYYGDTGTTLIFGKGASDAEKTHAALWDVLDSNLDLFRAGTVPSSILSAFAKSYRTNDIKNVGYEGHGIGLETREHPILKSGGFSRISDGIVDVSTDIPLEEGMTINFETPKSEPGRGGFQVERTFLIGKGKVKEITPKRDGLSYRSS
jgi:Xaa-Pro aminopeptidase